MKSFTGYLILDKSGKRPLRTNEKIHIFWNRKVAKQLSIFLTSPGNLEPLKVLKVNIRDFKDFLEGNN